MQEAKCLHVGYKNNYHSDQGAGVASPGLGGDGHPIHTCTLYIRTFIVYLAYQGVIPQYALLLHIAMDSNMYTSICT